MTVFCPNAGVAVAAEMSNGTADTTAPEEPAAEEEPVTAPAGWGGWQPLAPQEEATVDLEARDPEADAAYASANPQAGQSGDEGDAPMEAAESAPQAADGGSDADDSDDEVAAAQPEEEQETEEELLAQCVRLCCPDGICLHAGKQLRQHRASVQAALLLL